MSKAWIQRRARRRLCFTINKCGGDNIKLLKSQYEDCPSTAGHFQDFVLQFERIEPDGKRTHYETDRPLHWRVIDWSRLYHFLTEALSTCDPSQCKSLIFDFPFLQLERFPQTLRLFFTNLREAYPNLEITFTETRIFFLFLNWQRDQHVMQEEGSTAPLLRQHFWIQLQPDLQQWINWFHDNQDYVSLSMNWTFNHHQRATSHIFYVCLVPASRNMLSQLSNFLQRLTYESDEAHDPAHRDDIVLRLDFLPLIEAEDWHSIALIVEGIRCQFNIDLVPCLPEIEPWHVTEDDSEDEDTTHHPHYYHWTRILTLNKIDVRVSDQYRTKRPGWHRAQYCPFPRAFEWRFHTAKYVSGLPTPQTLIAL